MPVSVAGSQNGQPMPPNDWARTPLTSQFGKALGRLSPRSGPMIAAADRLRVTKRRRKMALTVDPKLPMPGQYGLFHPSVSGALRGASLEIIDQEIRAYI